MQPSRRMAYDFLSLPYDVRGWILEELGSGGDEPQEVLFRRTVEKGKVGDLRKAITAHMEAE